MSSSKTDSRESSYFSGELSPTQTNGLNYSAGVVTSIPYDSVAADLNRQPVPVDYALRPVSRGDEQVTPHGLGKFGDFHQYPQVYPSADQHYSPHPSGPRPPPSSNNSSSTVTSNSHYHNNNNNYYHHHHHQQQHQQPTSPYSNSTFSTRQHDPPNQPYYNSIASNSSNSSYPRSSSDQASVFSSLSSATRNSIISVSPSFADLVPSPVNFNSPDGFSLERPREDRIVEQMFYELMEKRGYMNLPEQAKRQMMAYPPSKKWVMVHQDKLADFQANQKRQIAAQAQGRDPDEDSPEWYVKKIMDGTITAKQLGSLSVSLRTQPIRYVMRKVYLGG